MKKLKRKSLIKKLDKLFADRIKQVGKCQRCSKVENLQCAHIFGRRNYAVRWDLMNALCLCWYCHFVFAHQNPIEFVEFVKSHLGESEYNLLRNRAMQIVKYSTDDLLKILEDLKK